MWGSGAGEVTSATLLDRQGGSASSASRDRDDPIPSTVDKGTLSIISFTLLLFLVRPFLTHNQMPSLPQEVAFLSDSQWPKCCLLNQGVAHTLSTILLEAFWAGLRCRPCPLAHTTGSSLTT